MINKIFGLFAVALLLSCSSFGATPEPSTVAPTPLPSVATEPSMPPTPEPTPSTPSSIAPTVVPSQDVMQSLPPPIEVDVRDPSVRTVTLKPRWDCCGLFVAHGDRAAYDDSYGVIRLADLTERRVTTVFDRHYGNYVLGLVFDGRYVAWLDGRFEHVSFDTPCEESGAMSWQVVVVDLTTGLQTTLHEGQQQENACQLVSPLVALDGGQLALAAEDDTGAWVITIESLSDHRLLRTVPASGPVESIGLSNGDLAFVVGETPVADSYPFIRSTRLMLSTTSNPDGFELTRDAYEARINNGRLVWLHASNPRYDDASNDLETSSVEHWQPIRLGMTTYAQGSIAPSFSTDDGVVAWIDGYDIMVWKVGSEVPVAIEPRQLFDRGAPNVSDGWLTWYGSREFGDPYSMFGVDLDDIPLN
jgi:hypothetical protein